MSKKKVNWEALRDQIKTTDKTILAAVVSSVDGHTIYDPKHFTEKELPEEVVKAFTKVLKSGTSPKEKIFSSGGEVKQLRGVYGLDVLEFIASVFGVSSWKMGRGSRAEHLTEQLLALWKTTVKEALVLAIKDDGTTNSISVPEDIGAVEAHQRILTAFGYGGMEFDEIFLLKCVNGCPQVEEHWFRGEDF